MSKPTKRTLQESNRVDNLPPTKKARYSYNPELQQRIPPQTTTNVLLNPTNYCINNSIASSILPKKQSSADNNTSSSWCPVQWFRNRVYHQDASQFFDILPFEEANGVTKQLLTHNGGSVTLTKNLIHTLYTMQKITKFIQNQISTQAQPKLKKEKKRFVREQNEILHTINIKQLQTNNQTYIDKIEKNISKYNAINKEYMSYENESKSILKSLSNTPTPSPPIAHTNTHTTLPTQPTQPQTIISHEESDSDESDSDESFNIHNDSGNSNDCYSRQRKKKRKYKKKKKKFKYEQEIAKEREKEMQAQSAQDLMLTEDGGKNPQYAVTEPHKFFKKFERYFEPQNPSQITNDICSEMQTFSYPTKIPSLPIKKSSNNFVCDFGQSMDDTSALNFDDLTNTNTNSHSQSNGNEINELYFAEMPTNYEYFANEKCFIDEQRNIESEKNNKYIKQTALHQRYPNKSLCAHSMDQRTLSCIVYQCDGLQNIERKVEENDWRKIGSKKLIQKSRKDKRVKDLYEDIDMIEPRIEYKAMELERNGLMNGNVSFEGALRQGICKYIFGNDISEMNGVLSMDWKDREDDDCCTTIKSLSGNLERYCFDYAPNDIDTNVQIMNEIKRKLENEFERNEERYDNWVQFDEYIEQIQKDYLERGLVIDNDTLRQAPFEQYTVQQTVEAFIPKDHIQTRQETS